MSIVGYSYQAEDYCDGDCVVKAVCLGNGFSRDDFPWGVEAALSQLGNDLGIYREKESTFDSSDFPKVILSPVELDEGQRLACCWCHESIDA